MNMLRVNIYLLVFFVFVSILACRNKDQQVLDTKENVQTLPSDFEVFYEKFHTDTAFQMAHIVFPLEGRPALRDGAPALDPSFRWEKSTWIIHRPYDDMGGSFSRSFLFFNDIVTEQIEDGTGQFTMVRRFAKMQGDWFLIYYKEMGK